MAKKKKAPKKVSTAKLKAQIVILQRNAKANHLAAVKIGRIGGLTTAVKKRAAKKTTKKKK
jgi:phosphoribosylformylglycinamidine (FGAM) synthase-like enzyme